MTMHQRQEHSCIRTDPFVGNSIPRPIYKSAVGELTTINLPDSFLYIRLYLFGFRLIYRLELSDKQKRQSLGSQLLRAMVLIIV